jgi:serine/threonine protein kinase/formylglycine-generating enzyme required for sulfatase activity
LNGQLKHGELKDPRIEAALREYLERLDRGEAVDRQAFLARYSEIADALRAFIAAEEELRKLAGDKASRESAASSTRSLTAHGQQTVVPQSMAKRKVEAGGGQLPGRFGRYRIIRALGKGAMGTVYLAEDTQIERLVALKTPHFTEDPSGEQMERFFREARAAGNLRHPHICPIYDFGQIDGKHFITMAYIEGRPLSAFIQPDNHQAERQILLLVRKLASALQEAHDCGVVHRDLKPANIMVDKKGEPIIMDFGLAQQTRRNEDVRLTQTGIIIGTPAFMSPEQVEGEPEKIGPPTDQYSLGVILYELLTGQLPFRGSVVAVMGQILTKEPSPPSQLRPDLDTRIEAVCLKMMAKDPSNRFASLKAAADEISSVLKSPAAKTTSKEKRASSQASLPPDDRMRTDAGASQVLKSLEQKTLTERDLESLEELARKCYSRHDFEQVIQIIERVPEKRRNAALQALLEKSRGKADEISFLICDIDEAERLNDRQKALKKAEELLKIKPGHRRAREIQEKFAGYGEGGAARIGLVKQFTQPWNEGGWIPWSALAFGLAVFGVMTGVIVIYLGKTAIVIDVKDPGVEVAVKGTTLTVTGPGLHSVKVTPGEQQLKISYAGLETHTKSFEIKKGDKKTVTVSIVNKQLVARLENEILPLTSSSGDGGQKKELGKHDGGVMRENKRSDTRSVSGLSTDEPKPNIPTTPPKFFPPFFVKGEWRIENDELVQPTLASSSRGNGNEAPLLVFGETTLSNYELTLEVKKTGGSGGLGVSFHWLGPGHRRAFSLGGNRWINLDYHYNGKWGREDGNGKGLSYSSNRWYSLTVKVRGDTFQIYLDGVLQFEQTDARFTHGRICLLTDTAAARFRRIKVSDPQGKVLFEGLPELPPASNKTTPKGTIGRSFRLPTTGETGAKSAQKRWAERVKTPVISTNSIGIKLALIPPGEFQMGSPKSERDRGGNEQQHRVRITKPFYLGVYEITQSEFEQVMGRNPSFFSNSGGHAEAATFDTSRYPVESASWYDAVEFCNSLSDKEGRRLYYRLADIEREAHGSIKAAKVSVEGGNGYRLPTEAQWEYACRGGTTTPFSFGMVNNGAECNCNGKHPYGTEEQGTDLARTVPVGSYRPNAFGLYDMHGNVWEWCWDAFDEAYYKHSPESDPAGPSGGSKRVMRGGSWRPNGGGGECRAANRGSNLPGSHAWWQGGFRVARSAGD